MQKTALLLVMMTMFMGNSFAQEKETIEISSSDQDLIAEQLDKEAEAATDSKTKALLKKVSDVFKKSKTAIEVEVEKAKTDCADCSKQAKAKNFFLRLGRTLGKGAAWVSTNTAKPFVTAAGFTTGVFEKEDKNKDIAAMYQFLLNHQAEFDDLYLEAGTPEEMVELMLAKMEEIMENKSRLLMRDVLLNLGIDRDLSSDFELSNEELARIDLDKLDPNMINKHPEYQEVRGILGDFTKQELQDIVASGYFSKSISFDNVKEALPKPYELAIAVAGQIVIPHTALGIISGTLASLYTTPVVMADIGTAVSVGICQQPDVRVSMKGDKELRDFCSYVTNKSAYTLVKSRAKGYIGGKKMRTKIAEKMKERRERKEQKRREKEELKLSVH